MFNQFNVEDKWYTYTDKIMSVSGELFVENDVDISGNLEVQGDVSFNSNVDISGNLEVQGDVSFNSNVDISGNLDVNGVISFNNQTGTAGQILKSQGNSASPEWKDYKLSELNDTTITNPSDNDILVYNSTNSEWENSNNLTSTNLTSTNFNITGSGPQNNKIGTSTIYNSTITGGVDETNNGYIEIDKIKTFTGQGRTGLTLQNNVPGGGSVYDSKILMQYNLDISIELLRGLQYDYRGNINLTASNRVGDKGGNIVLNASGDVKLGNGTLVSSDDRIKHNEVNIVNGLDIVRQIVPQKYHKTKEMYEENYTGNNYRIESGFIAQDILKIPDLTYCVSGGDYIDENNNNVTSKYYLAYQDIFVYGMAATKELDTIVQNQQTEINDLKQENTLLKSKLNEILSEMGKETI